MNILLNKGLKKDEKAEGLLKRLKNIEDKTDNRLSAIESQRDEGMKFTGNNCKQNLSPEGFRVFNQIVEIEKLIDYSYLYMDPRRRNINNFRMFRKLKPLFEEISFGRKTIDSIKRDQN